MNEQLTTARSDEIIAPSQSLTVSERERSRAAIESRIQQAVARSRDVSRDGRLGQGIPERLELIKSDCQRVGLAERATYLYQRGGQDITGPSIDLVRVIATRWGNLDFGFREIARGPSESTVEAYAVDLESNVTYTRALVVPHTMDAYGKQKRLEGDLLRDRIANVAQRSVRTCLENVIPKDVVEMAVERCAATLKEKVDLNPEKIAALVKRLAGIGVAREQVEARYQRPTSQLQPAQYLELIKIGTAIADGVATVDDHFKPIEEPEPEKKPAAAPASMQERAAASLGDEPADDGPEFVPDETEPEPEPAPPRGKKPTQKELRDEYVNRLDVAPDIAAAANIAAEIDADEQLSPTSKKQLSRITSEIMQAIREEEAERDGPPEAAVGEDGDIHVAD